MDTACKESSEQQQNVRKNSYVPSFARQASSPQEAFDILDTSRKTLVVTIPIELTQNVRALNNAISMSSKKAFLHGIVKLSSADLSKALLADYDEDTNKTVNTLLGEGNNLKDLLPLGFECDDRDFKFAAMKLEGGLEVQPQNTQETFTFSTGIDPSTNKERELYVDHFVVQGNSNAALKPGYIHKDETYYTLCWYLSGKGLKYWDQEGKAHWQKYDPERPQSTLYIHRGLHHPLAQEDPSLAATHSGFTYTEAQQRASVHFGLNTRGHIIRHTPQLLNCN